MFFTLRTMYIATVDIFILRAIFSVEGILCSSLLAWIVRDDAITQSKEELVLKSQRKQRQYAVGIKSRERELCINFNILNIVILYRCHVERATNFEESSIF